MGTAIGVAVGVAEGCVVYSRGYRALLFSYLNTPHPLSTTHRTLTPPHNREMITSLKRDCLCNYDFVLAKLEAGNHEYRDDLCADYEMTLRTVSGGDADVKLISDTLVASGHAVKRHCSQLSSQVSGAPARVWRVFAYVRSIRADVACGQAIMQPTLLAG